MSSNKRAKTTNMPAPIAMRSSMDAPPSKTPRNCIEFEFVTPNMVDYPFLDEVRAMMYAQGDCAEPLIETAKRMHEIVERQLCALVSRAQRAAVAQSTRHLRLHHMLLALRTNMPILKRLGWYVRTKDMSATLRSYSTAQNNGGVDDVVDDDDPELVVDELASTSRDVGESKRMAELRAAAELIDCTGELLAIINSDGEDVVRQASKGASLCARSTSTGKLRQSSTVARLEPAEYARYTQARAVTFMSSRRNAVARQRLHEWLFERPTSACARAPVPEPHSLVMLVINFLATQIVASVVDACVVIKNTGKYVEENFDIKHTILLPERVQQWRARVDQQQEQVNGGRSHVGAGRYRAEFSVARGNIGYDAAVKHAFTPKLVIEAYRRLTFNHHILHGYPPHMLDILV